MVHVCVQHGTCMCVAWYMYVYNITTTSPSPVEPHPTWIAFKQYTLGWFEAQCLPLWVVWVLEKLCRGGRYVKSCVEEGVCFEGCMLRLFMLEGGC